MTVPDAATSFSHVLKLAVDRLAVDRLHIEVSVHSLLKTLGVLH